MRSVKCCLLILSDKKSIFKNNRPCSEMENFFLIFDDAEFVITVSILAVFLTICLCAVLSQNQKKGNS